MKSEIKYTLNESHLLFAKKANGETWQLLEKETLSEEEKDLLLYTVFASSYHWAFAGEVVNKQRGEWLISRAYSKLEMSDACLFHAKKCLKCTQDETANFMDFDYAYANEALSRSYALLGRIDKAQFYYDKAINIGKKISNEKDRKLFIDDLKSGNWNEFAPVGL